MPASFSHSASQTILGAFVGDALGTTLEFARSPTPDQISFTMSMPGGGPFGLTPGQITDDSELALALSRGLRGKSAQEGFPADSVRREYQEWLRGGPFDVGATCRAAFSSSPKPRADSKANGALMRATALAVWAHPSKTGLTDDQVFVIGMEDAKLSHPNATTVNANGAYVVTLTRLLTNPEDVEGAWSAARDCITRVGVNDGGEVLGWLEVSGGTTLPFTSCFDQMGFARWGFTLAFHHLLRGTSYVDAMRDVLSRGGDTDTNCCIVGGMLGAAGREIPLEWIEKVRTYTCVTGSERPERYASMAVRELVDDPEEYFFAADA